MRTGGSFKSSSKGLRLQKSLEESLDIFDVGVPFRVPCRYF